MVTSKRALVAACGLAAATVGLTGAGVGAGARAAAFDLTAQKVSGWRAPGVRVTVTGWGPADGTVVLRERGHVVATATAGPRGRFRLGFATLRPGRYPLTVSATGETLSAGAVQIRPVTLAAVGDITFGEQVGPTLGRLGGRYPWTSVAPLLSRADVTTGNLETSVSARGTPSPKEYTFRGAPWMLRPVHSFAGFDVLTLANNHAVDYGHAALLDTIHAVQAAGMEPIGAGATAWRARRPALVTSGGLRIALLGYSDVNPPGFTATAGSPAPPVPIRRRSPPTFAPSCGGPTSPCASSTGASSCTPNPTRARRSSRSPACGRARPSCSARTRTSSAPSSGPAGTRSSRGRSGTSSSPPRA